jgi:GNAT superfamily N-acetyltransferase
MDVELDVQPVTAARWSDLVELAGERGFQSGCWCMWWRLSNKEFGACSGDEKQDALHDLVRRGREPGMLAYRAGEPVGWVTVARRAEFTRLNRSTKLFPVDDTPVWSVPCFYVHRSHRRRGVTEALLDAAVAHATAYHAELLEGYPIDTGDRKRAGGEMYTGSLTMFERAGFTEVARRGGRPIVRKRLASPPPMR